MAEGGGLRAGRRPAVWVPLFALVLICGIGIGWWLGVGVSVEHSLLSRHCEALRKVDLSVPEIVKLKDRWKAYSRDKSADAFMRLSTREASWLLSAESGINIWLEGSGDGLRAHVTAPIEGGCYNVHYEGKVSVADGTAVLEAESFVVGGVDLADIAAAGVMSNRRVVTPEDLQDEVWSRQLRGVEKLQVRDGELQVRFADPSTVWQ